MRRLMSGLPFGLLFLSSVLLIYGTLTPLDPQSGLAAALQTTRWARTMHVMLEMRFTPHGPGKTFQMRMEGDVQFPDRQYLEVVFNGQEYKMIMVGSELYTFNPETGRWRKEKVSGPSSLFLPIGTGTPGPFDPQEVLNMSVPGSVVEELPPERVDGVLYRRYRVRMGLDALVAALRERIQDPIERTWIMPLSMAKDRWRMEAVYWVGAEDHLVRRVRMSFSVPQEIASSLAGEGAIVPGYDLEITMQFSDFNKPVTITPPPVEAPSAR